jgi:hypothetical protein
MTNATKIMEVLGCSLTDNGDGTYTITYASEWAPETFGRYLPFTEQQAVDSFLCSVDVFMCRND